MRTLLALLAAVAVCQIGLAQFPPPPTVQSPNTASLGTYGTIPVSFSTGTPDISIPIYTLRSGRIEVPVVLSYNQNSVRPNEHPGWVGLGWSLRATGMITRVVRGTGDEFESNNDGIFRNYYNSGRYKLNGSDWASQSKIKTYFQVNNNELVDTEPDMFSFNFLGYSGTFFLTSSGWKAIADRNIKIEVNSFVKENIASRIKANLPNFPYLTPTQPYFKNYFQFTLTTEDGTKYVFGGLDAGGEDAVEYTTNYDRNIFGYKASAWYLIRIIDPNNHVVEFKYHRKYPVCSFAMTASQMFSDCSGPGGGGGWTAQNILVARHAGTVVFPVYLDEIVGETEKIKFLTSYSTELRYTDNYFQSNDDTSPIVDPTQRLGLWLRTSGSQVPDYNNVKWEQLDQIQIQNSNGSVFAKYSFGYSNSTSQRLTLNYFYEDSPTTAERKTYAFSYNNVAGLPAYGGDRTDHWGYFNDRSIDGLSFVALEAGSNATKNKNVNTSVITRGLINKIVYPTGGYTEFDWEAHAFSKVLATNKTSLETYVGNGGGCRIKEIRSYSSSTATPVKKTYYYLSNYTGSTTGLSSSGVLNGRPQYHISLSGRQTISGQHTITYQSESLNSTVNYGVNTQGSPVAYAEVIEKNTDGSYSKYLYTSYAADIYGIAHYDTPPNGTIGWNDEEDRFVPFSSRERERGKLLRVTHYTNTNKPVQQTQYAYNNDPNRFNDFVKCTEMRESIGCPNNGADALVYAAAFSYYTYRYNVVSETVTQYNPDLTPINTTKTYAYNDYGLLEEETVTQSDGTKLQTLYKYAGDYSNSTYISSCQTAKTICEQNANTARSQCYSACGGNAGCMSGCEGAYGGQMSVCQANYGQCINAYPSSNIIVALKDRHNLSAPVETQNRLIYPDNSKVLLGGTFNQYQYFNSLILPRNFLKIETNAPLTDLTLSDMGTNGNLAYHSNYKASGTIDSYDVAGNITQYHKADGVVSSYLWGYNNTRLVAEATNARVNEIFFNGFEESTGWDSNLTGYDNTRTKSGTYSGKIVKSTSGELYSHSSQWLTISSSTSPRTYKYSGWVYSNGPSVDIYLFMKTPTESAYYTYVDHVSTTVTGEWVYLEKEYTVPGNITKLNLRIDNNGGGTVWFDDMRLHPASARMTTYTYDPVNGLGLTSMTDANNVSLYYEYDSFQRLKLIRDQDKKIVKHYQYHYQGQY